MTLGFIIISFNTNAFHLKNGDLIFQESCSTNVNDAIKTVTSSADGYNFTHVGIVYIQEADTFVIEAAPPSVSVTPLQNYLYPDSEKSCPPVSVVGRLVEKYQSLIPYAIREALRLVGKEYDYIFILNNDKYYCSELIYDILLKANENNPVFELNTMTFKAPNSKEYLPNWVDYYKKLGAAIPEGQLGINPGAMSRSSVITILYKY